MRFILMLFGMVLFYTIVYAQISPYAYQKIQADQARLISDAQQVNDFKAQYNAISNDYQTVNAQLQNDKQALIQIETFDSQQYGCAVYKASCINPGDCCSGVCTTNSTCI